MSTYCDWCDWFRSMTSYDKRDVRREPRGEVHRAGRRAQGADWWKRRLDEPLVESLARAAVLDTFYQHY